MCCVAPSTSSWKCQVYYLLFDRMPLNDVCFCYFHVVQDKLKSVFLLLLLLLSFCMILMTNWFHIQSIFHCLFFSGYFVALDCLPARCRYSLRCNRTMNRCFFFPSIVQVLIIKSFVLVRFRRLDKMYRCECDKYSEYNREREKRVHKKPTTAFDCI